MNKKLFTIMFVAIFLIASIGFVSASDDAKNISVKFVWDDNGNDILDGKVVDTAKLSDSNSWKTAFKNLDPNEDYTITVDDISGFTLKTSKDGESGFIITGIAQESVLGASDDQATVSGDDDPATGDNPVVPFSFSTRSGSLCRSAIHSQRNHRPPGSDARSSRPRRTVRPSN